MSLLEKALKKIEDSKKILQEEKKEIKIAIQKPSKKELIIIEDLNKDKMCKYLTNFILTNKDVFPLDWFRGLKIMFESIKEMINK